MNTLEESTFDVRVPGLKVINEFPREYLLGIHYLPDRTITNATGSKSMRHGPCPLETYGFVEETRLTHMCHIKYII